MSPDRAPERPLLPGLFRVIPMGPDAVQLRSAGRVVRLSTAGAGPAVASFLTALDGSADVAELARRCGVDLDTALAVVSRLLDAGLLGGGVGTDQLPAARVGDARVGDAPVGAGGVGGEAVEGTRVGQERAGGSRVAGGTRRSGVATVGTARRPMGTLPSNLAQRGLFAELGAPGRAAQARISAATVAVVGLGPVGRIAARHLAGAGVLELVLVDAGTVTALDQATLAGSPEWIDRPRAEAAQAEARGLEAGPSNGVGVPGAASAGPAITAVAGAAALAWQLDSTIDLVIVEVDASGAAATAWNRACLGGGVPFLAHELSTFKGIVGPAVTAPRGPCFECARVRRLSHLRHYDEQVAYEQQVRAGAVAPLEATVLAGAAAIVGGLASVEALRLIGGFQPAPTRAGVLIVDLVTSEVRREEVLAVPGCTACGDTGDRLAGAGAT